MMDLQDKGKLAAAQANREVGTQLPAPKGCCGHLHGAVSTCIMLAWICPAGR